MIGPPSAPPHWLRLYFGFSLVPASTPACANLSRRFIAWLRKNSNASPVNMLVPLLVTIDTVPPGRQPYCAGCCDVWTANSRTPACGMSLRGYAVFAVTFGTPSTRKFVDAVPIAAPTDAFGRLTRAVS